MTAGITVDHGARWVYLTLFFVYYYALVLESNVRIRGNNLGGAI